MVLKRLIQQSEMLKVLKLVERSNYFLRVLFIWVLQPECGKLHYLHISIMKLKSYRNGATQKLKLF